MNPGAKPECENIAMVLLVHELWTLFVDELLKIVALSRTTSFLRSRIAPRTEAKTFWP